VRQDLRRESEELLRYCGELDRRIGEGGIADISGLLELSEQLERALNAVSEQELLWAEERAKQLIEELRAVSEGLEAMRQLKARLGSV
jgi:hypothetical protein